MNLAIYFQDAYDGNLYVVDTGMVTADTPTGGGSNPPAANTDAWGYSASWATATVDLPAFSGVVSPGTLQGPLFAGTLIARGHAISPDGTKLAVAMANGGLRQYKIQVWDVGAAPPTITSTISGPLKMYGVQATKIKEYTKNTGIETVDTVNLWVNGGVPTVVNLSQTHGVLDLQVSNDGDLWWLEQDYMNGVPNEECSDVFYQASPLQFQCPMYDSTVFRQKANVQELLFAASSPTTLGAFLLGSTASPWNANNGAGIEGNFAALYYGGGPGAFIPAQIIKLWDGSRARVFCLARNALTANGLSYNDGSAASQMTSWNWWNTPVDTPGGKPYENITEDAADQNLLLLGIYEPGIITTRTSVDTSGGGRPDFTYLDQLNTAAWVDTEEGNFGITNSPYQINPLTFNCVTGILGAYATRYTGVRKTDAYITAAIRHASDAHVDIFHVLRQDVTTGAIERLTATDALPTSEAGTFSLGVFAQAEIDPTAVLWGATRQALIDPNWELRLGSVSAGPTLDLSATLEAVTPGSPEFGDEFIRTGVSGAQDDGGAGGTPTYLPTGTISG